ncbi:hypothetical protein BJI48_02455 [Helicobacter sp. 11S02596-1]|nr:hypothetical protein BJI48_02455 [Helicobacter sp. 11S02596-1]
MKRGFASWNGLQVGIANRVKNNVFWSPAFLFFYYAGGGVLPAKRRPPPCNHRVGGSETHCTPP